MSIISIDRDEEDEENARLERELSAKATPEKMAELRDRHVRMYRRRLEHGSPMVVNTHETLTLLRIWEGMGSKTLEQLSEVERAEVLDALAAEE